MNVSVVPSEKRRWAEILAQQIDIGEHPGENGSCHRWLARTWKKSSRDGKRGKSMSDDVHGYEFALAFDSEGRPLRGTSSLSARGTILNSTGRRASGSPSTCA